MGRGVHTWQQVSQAAAAASWRVCLRAQARVNRVLSVFALLGHRVDMLGVLGV